MFIVASAVERPVRKLAVSLRSAKRNIYFKYSQRTLHLFLSTSYLHNIWFRKMYFRIISYLHKIDTTY